MTDKGYTDALLEDVNDKFDILVDGFKGVREEIKTLAKQSDLDEVKSDVKAIKTAVTTTNHDLNDLKTRVDILEAA